MLAPDNTSPSTTSDNHLIPASSKIVRIGGGAWINAAMNAAEA